MLPDCVECKNGRAFVLNDSAENQNGQAFIQNNRADDWNGQAFIQNDCADDRMVGIYAKWLCWMLKWLGFTQNGCAEC